MHDASLRSEGCLRLDFGGTQIAHHVKVTWLPVVTPTENQREDPALYANAVRAAIVSAGGFRTLMVPTTVKWVLHGRILRGELPWKWFRVLPHLEQAGGSVGQS